MEEFLPWMLLLLSGDPGRPEALTLVRQPGLSATREECEARGHAREDGTSNAAIYKCLQMPGGGEIDAAWQQVRNARSQGAGQ